MAIASMTGFARGEGQSGNCTWTWEVRSVNGRGLEVRCRLPLGFEGLEPAVRQRITGRLRRGSVAANLLLSWSSGRQGVRINTDALDQVINLIPQLRDRLPECEAPRIDGLLGLRGIIEQEDVTPTGEVRAALDAAVLAGLDDVLSDLVIARQSEGARLEAVLSGHLDRVTALTRQAGELAAAQPEAIFQRLKEQVAALLEAIPAPSADRLAQEAALLAVKADPREELDRLAAHCEAARQLLSSATAIGRQLDFLCQEFNREANTLCSKSSDVELTRLGLELKGTIDQLREQVQNIE